MTVIKILIAEDELLMALHLSHALQKIGCEVFEPIVNGEDVPAAFFASTPDLVLLDVNLQGTINGIQAAQCIRKQSQAPIIFMTGYTDDETLAQIRDLGASTVITKPIAVEWLSETIQRMIRSAD